MGIRDRLFLWWNGYCTYHLTPNNEMYGFVWCDLCQEQEAVEKALKSATQ